MTKEIILIAAVVLSLAIIYFTFKKMNKLELSKPTRHAYTYLTLIIPLLGFILVSRHKNE